MTSTLNRVERACTQLRHDGQRVTFTAVAARTGLSRTTLYRNPALRAVIDSHRHRTAASGTLGPDRRDQHPPHRRRRPRRQGPAPRRTTAAAHRPHKLKALTGQYKKRRILAG